MPANLWEGVGANNGVRPTRALVASDWERFFKYSYRIKSLTCDTYVLRIPDLLHVYEALRQGFAGDYLLPKLELSGQYLDPNFLPFMDLFLYRALRRSTLDIVRPTSTTLYCPVAPTDLHRSQISTFVRALTHVQFLEVGDLDLASLSHVGRLPTLETLNITLPSGISFPGIAERSMFCHLRAAKLYIDHGDTLAVSAFLRTWENAPMESFDVEFGNCPLPERMEEVYRIPYFPNTPPGAFMHLGHVFKSLFCFTNLGFVECHVTVGFDLDDTTISDMVQFIEYLRFSFSSCDHLPSSTLLGLKALANTVYTSPRSK
ncbi:hypothetical protein C8R44DRAFT_977352 [Mycena epipterygia]|nr:hypothetical protein C8R44DRAFT_977352 [Mycena epipterygia]